MEKVIIDMINPQIEEYNRNERAKRENKDIIKFPQIESTCGITTKIKKTSDARKLKREKLKKIRENEIEFVFIKYLIILYKSFFL